MNSSAMFNRRQLIALGTATVAGLALPGLGVSASATPLYKTIPVSGEQLPVIGMGTSRTFDAIGNSELLVELQQVTQIFYDMGGSLIDSSPMYGSSELVIGQILAKLNFLKGQTDRKLFSATKVWTRGKQKGVEQMAQSLKLWGIDSFDLIQVHNLVDWESQLETLAQMKVDGKIRYTGITTSHGRDHKLLARVLKSQAIDFVQLSYNIQDRTVENELLPIARDKGIAVIVNRPYQRGQLFSRVKGKALPPWAAEFDCASWGQFFLKYCVSHPAVTCVIPATSKVKHMRDNMLAGKGRLPTAKQRLQMQAYFEAL